MNQSNEESKATSSPKKSANNEFFNTEYKADKELLLRKPVINTMRKNTSKMLKVVGSVNTKPQPAQLEICLPTEHNNKEATTTDTSGIRTKPVVSRINVSKKPGIRNPVVRKKSGGSSRGRSKVITSPDPSAARNNPSPVTEVAKWAPKSVTHDTKPYYEAWVDTTLAAVAKDHTNDAMFIGKRDIIKQFRRSLEKRDVSPEIVYTDFSDERFTGRIKVRQRYVYIFSFDHIRTTMIEW